MPGTMPEARYVSIPLMVVGRELGRRLGLELLAVSTVCHQAATHANPRPDVDRRQRPHYGERFSAPSTKSLMTRKPVSAFSNVTRKTSPSTNVSPRGSKRFFVVIRTSTRVDIGGHDPQIERLPR